LRQYDHIVKHLAIELSEIAVRFSSIKDGIIANHEFNFNDKKDYLYKEQLDEFLIESGLKNEAFDEHTVSWSSFRSTLIPANIFGESKPEALFKLCYGTEVPVAHIDYNRIPEHGLVNLYEIPLWVKSFFVIKYPRSIIQHAGSHMIRGIFSEPSFKLKSSLIIYHNYFILSIVKENKLHFYSMFDYQITDDIVYHLMFTLQQKEFLHENGAINLCAGAGSSKENITELSNKLQSLVDLKNAAITINNDFITNSQKLCV
jgi:hypothetical protein